MIADSLDPNNPISGEQDGIPRQQFAYDPPSIERLRKMFDDSRSLKDIERRKGVQRRSYYDGPGQLQSEVRRTLKARGQPAIYTNRVRPAINGLLGVLEQGQTDPRAFPRNPQDQGSADVATKGLRYVADVTRYQRTKLDVAENFFVEGTGAAIFEWDGQTPTVTQIRWEEFFYDPYSRRLDFKDARYMGVAKWMDLDALRGIYPDALRPLGDPMSGNSSALDATWQDRPDNTSPWVDRTRNRLMVVELYHNEGGQWFRCVYIAAGVLEYDLSPYRNVRTGETRCPIEAQSCYVDGENGRYSPIDDMIPIQDEVNARRSRLLHLANSRQIQQSDASAAPVDPTTARSEAAKADGIIPAGWELVPTADIASGQQLLLAESKSEIERMGPTPAVLGQQGNAAQSGRSRLVLQQAGMTELARPIGGITDWDNRGYRQMWLLMQQYWTGPTWIRVTDDPKAPQFLQINEPAFDEGGQPILAVDTQTGMPQMQPVAGPDGQPMIDPATGQPAMQPVQQVNHRIAEMDMDIIIDSVPDTANLEQEVWTDLLELTRSGIPIGSPQFMIAVEMSPLPNKAEIIERVESWMAKQQPQPDPVQEQAVMLEMQEKAAAIKNKDADTEKKQADTAQTYFEMGRNSVADEPEPVAEQSAP
jgi:hypothetical protein